MCEKTLLDREREYEQNVYESLLTSGFTDRQKPAETHGEHFACYTTRVDTVPRRYRSFPLCHMSGFSFHLCKLAVIPFSCLVGRIHPEDRIAIMVIEGKHDSATIGIAT